MRFKCLKCNLYFENEKEYVKHQVDTGRYSPHEHTTWFHNVIEVSEK